MTPPAPDPSGVPDAGAPISFRDPDLRAWLEELSDLARASGSAGQRARTELGMWRYVQDAALRSVVLPLEWASLLAAVVAGSIIVDMTGPLLHAELHDAFAPDALGRSAGYGDAHGADEAAVLAWAGQLDIVTDLALRRAFARWWADEGSEVSVESFARHGIRVRH